MTSKRLISAVLLAATFFISALSSEASWSELSPRLEETLNRVSPNNSDSLVSVLVFLNSSEAQARIKSIASSHQTRSGRIRSIINDLKSTRVDGVEKIRGYIREHSQTESREFWITPAMTATLTLEQIYELSDIAGVSLITEDALLDYIEPVDIKAAPSLASSNSNQLSLLGIPQLWSKGLTGNGRLVCSFDTGVEGTHPALNSKWRGNHASLSSSWFSPVDPGNPPSDKIGHGTHTMGIMVGSTPTDTFGVAPGAEWISAGVVDQGRSLSVTLADIVNAFQWALNPDGDINTTTDVPDVILNSWGIPKNLFTPCDSTFNAVIDAVEAAGIVTIFAAGNEGPNPMTIRSPADIATSPTNTFSVGAVDDNKVVASFSSRGPSSCDNADKKPEVMAPGVNIRSSYKGGGYSYMSGSSMAAPYIAGLVALIRQHDPEASVAQIKNALINAAIDLGDPGDDNSYGYGFIDATKVLDNLNSVGPSEFSIDRINLPNNGLLAIGETSGIEILLKSSSPITTVLTGRLSTTRGNSVEINAGEVLFRFSGGGLFAYSGTAFRVSLSSDVYNGQAIPFSLELLDSGGGLVDNLDFVIGAGIIPPGETETHHSGALSFTVSDFGQFGLGAGSIYNAGGEGLRYRNGADLLYEAGLIVGLNPDQVASSVRDSLGAFAVSDFAPSQEISPGMYGADGGFHLTAELKDNSARLPAGLSIYQETVNFDNYYDNQFVILKYTLLNNSVEQVSGLHCGMLVDFDLGSDEQLTYDAALNIVYQYRATGDVVGLIGLEGISSFASRENPSGTKVGLSQSEKYNLVSSNTIDVDETGRSDFMIIAASGDLNIAPSYAAEVGFAIIVADDVSGLLAAAQQARQKYDILTSVSDYASGNLPIGIELRQNYPNPFNPTTTIAFRLTRTEEISLDIYNLLGQKVTNLFSGRLPSGFHSFEWDASNVTGQRSASGVYFYRLTWSGGVDSKKMVLIK